MTADAPLETTEARLRALLQSTLQAMVLLDRDGCVLAFNQVADEWSRRVIGRPYREGLLLEDHVAGFGIADLNRHLATALSGQVVQSDTEVKDTQGQTRWYRTHYSPVTTDEGVVGVAMTVADFTEIRRALAALRESEHRLELALEGGGLGLWDWDMARRRMTFDRRTLLSLGLSPEPIEWNEEDAAALTHPDDQPRSAERLRQYLAGEMPVYQVNVRARHADGTWRWVQSRGKVAERGQDGRPLRMVGTYLDIDERVRADAERERLTEELRQAQKMEAIGRLAGGIAHDFNNLLTAISCNADVALRRLPASHPAARPIEDVAGAVKRAAELTAQLLAFGRKQVLDARPLVLDEVVSGFESILRRLMPETIELAVATGATGRCVRADPSQLEQVLMNLALNGRDSMSGGGRLIIETSEVELPEQAAAAELVGAAAVLPPGRYAVLAVADSGEGIAPEVLPHVFEPFFTTKDAGRGTGLGLSTVYGIVRQHGGEIVCDAGPAGGARFRVLLPSIATPPEAADSERPGPDRAARRSTAGDTAAARATVLVVEDQGMVRRVLCELLSDSGYAVLEASSPDQAIELAARHAGDIDLLLSDVVMPRMSGIELADRLSGEYPDLAVLLVSGYPDDPDLERSAGRREFLAKPYAPGEIIERIERMLRS